MTFPDEHYSYEEMQESSVFIGAYDENQCVGLAILRAEIISACFLSE